MHLSAHFVKKAGSSPNYWAYRCHVSLCTGAARSREGRLNISYSHPQDLRNAMLDSFLSEIDPIIKEFEERRVMDPCDELRLFYNLRKIDEYGMRRAVEHIEPYAEGTEIDQITRFYEKESEGLK